MTLGWPDAVSGQHRRIAARRELAQASLPLDGAAPAAPPPTSDPLTPDERLCADHAAAVARVMAEVAQVRRDAFATAHRDTPRDVVLDGLRRAHRAGYGQLSDDGPGGLMRWTADFWGVRAQGPTALAAAARWRADACALLPPEE